MGLALQGEAGKGPLPSGLATPQRQGYYEDQQVSHGGRLREAQGNFRPRQKPGAMDREYGIDALKIIAREDLAHYLGVLMRVARIGEVSLQERDLAVPIARLLGATEEQTMEAIKLADDDSVSLAELVAPLEHGVTKLCLFRDACRMACADGVVVVEESEILQRLASELGLETELAAEISEQVKVAWFTQSEFLELLRKEADRG